MKTKLIISVLLVVVFMFQVAGCAQQTPSEPATSTPADTVVSEPGEKDFSEPQKISWAVWADQLTDINNDDFAKIWAERFNVEWDIITMTFDTWDEKVRIWANAQDLPDVTQWSYNHVDGMIYAEQELIMRLPDDWQAKWPNTAKAFTDTEIGPRLIEEFGGTYYLPRPVFSNNKPTETLLHHQGIYMRKDWVEAVGAEVKPYYSVEELMDVARLIKANDPGNAGDNLIPMGNGIADLPWLFIYPLSTYSMSSYEYYQDDDGNYQWGPAAQETLEGLKYYEQAYREGLLHPEFFVKNTGVNHQENFYMAGISGMCSAPGMAQVALRFSNNFKENLDLETEEWLNFAFCVGLDGKYHGPEAPNFWGTLMFSPSLSAEKFERVMDVIDYSCTNQGQYEIRMGIEGIDWELDANGELVNLMEAGMTAVDKYYCIRPFYHNMYILSDDFGLINPSYPQVFRDMSYNQYQTKYSLVDDSSLGRTDWDVYFHDSDAKRRAYSDLSEEYAALVIADGEMESKWNAWVAEKMKLVQPVLDELNAK